MKHITSTATMLDAALSYVERGVPVIPVWWIANGRCACGKVDCESPGKHPVGAVVPKGVKEATADAAIIQAWWTRYPSANIATPTSWCTVLDIDPRHSGDAALAALERQHGAFPETGEVLTGGHGRHLYFRPVPGLGNSSSKVGSGLDIKATGGYVLLPPSSHVSGGIYRDDVGHPLFETPLAEMPAWLVALASTLPPQSTNGHRRTSNGWAQKLIGAPEGERRAVALEIAGHYLGLGIVPEEVEQILAGYAARCNPPFPEREACELVSDLARRDRAKAQEAASVANGHRSPWDSAQPVAEFLAFDDGNVQFLDELHTMAPGALTEWFSPRGIGKTHVLHSLLVDLARRGKRVLLLDRDNPKREIKRRLHAWGAAGLDAPNFRVMTRDDTPPLTDRGAWEQFPFAKYDVVALDSLDASTEGVGEQDSSKPARAIAPLLDLAHRADGPAVVVLGNTTKSGLAGRGSGVIEDRADIVFEVRDATEFQPTGREAWCEELPLAARIDWANRATRRKRRETYRLAFVATKFRVGEEPAPFVIEIDLTTRPWSMRDATAEVVAVGEQARDEANRESQRRLDDAAAALVADLGRRQAAGAEMPGKRQAEVLFMATGITRKSARTLLADRAGKAWSFDRKDHKTTLVTPLVREDPAESASPAEAHKELVFSGSDTADRIDTGRPHFPTKRARKTAASRDTAGGDSPPACVEETASSPLVQVKL